MCKVYHNCGYATHPAQAAGRPLWGRIYLSLRMNAVVFAGLFQG